MSDDRIIRIENKIDVLYDKLSSIDRTLSAQHESLKEHIRRSDLLEAQLEPIKQDIAIFKGAWKFIAGIGFIAGIALSIMELIRLL